MTTILMIIFQILIACLSAYLLYYAQKKGKNQADKEDLRKLTEVVEEVKKKNNEELEVLKANLSLFSDRGKHIFVEEKQAIVDFFAKLNSWIWESLSIYIHDYNNSNLLDISTRLAAMRNAYNQTNVSFSRVKLISSDKELIEAGHNAIMKTLDLHHFKEDLLKRLSLTLSGEKVLSDQILDKEFHSRTVSDYLLDFYQRQAKKHENDKKAITDEYYAKHKDIFSPAIVEVNNFGEKAREYLRENK